MTDQSEASDQERQYRKALERKRVDVASLSIREPDLYRIFVECSRNPYKPLRATEEQCALLRYRPRMRQRVVVQAFAGAGKTTLCRMLAHRLSPLRVLYLAYNRMAAAEARSDMPKNVDARTIHSLAMRYVGGSPKRLNQNTPGSPLSLRDPQAIRSFEKFCRDPCATEPDHFEAKVAWQRMTGGVEPYTYDGMLKKMTLDGAQSRQWISLAYDVVIVDEAQDSQPAFIDWFERIDDMILYAVGDRFQSIYSFNGTVNAMQSMRDNMQRDSGECTGEDMCDDSDGDDEEGGEGEEEEDDYERLRRAAPVIEFALTKSFRFGDNLGVVASDILRRAALYPANVPLHSVIVSGDPSRCTKIERIHNLIDAFHDGNGPVYCLARQNATLIRHALNYQAQREGARVAFFGNAANIMTQLREVMCETPEWRKCESERLRKKRNARRLDPEMVPELLDWEKQRDAAFRAVYKTPDAIVNLLLQKIVFQDDGKGGDDEDSDEADEADEWGDDQAEWFLTADADVHYGTVHSAKGLEFDRIALLDDMVPLREACEWLTRTKSDPNANDRSLMPPALRKSVGRPHYNVTARDQVREEVHLCYVAITRAKHVLYVGDELYRFACDAVSRHSVV